MTNGTLEEVLYRYFGHTSFRTGQKEIIEDILSGKDVLGILPTGTGKSICYQLPAITQRGTVLVVSPLISLMVDQVKQMKAQGFKRVVAINSFLDFQQKKKAFKHLGQYQLIYCSPEMLQNHLFIQELQQLSISLFVVDEAHCISQWGHEFRTDYLKLKNILKKLNHPTVLALSATAPSNVQVDIIHQLNRPNMIKHIYPMDRENIAFAVEFVNHMDGKIQRMKEILKQHPVPTMIYFSSRQWTEKAALELNKSLSDMRVAFYHGGMEQTDRLLIQQQFMNDQLDVICCTNAFGMGVNKMNIRLVIHAHLPSQLESFLQEIGRAGRDGKQSVSLTFYGKGDSKIPRNLIRGELPEKSVVTKALKYLRDLANAEEKVPDHEEALLSNLQINEIHWRFLKYQFEKHGIIDDNNSINYNKEHWNEVFIKIQAFLDHRLEYKENQLSSLLNWIHHGMCRRKRLYTSFQSTIKEPTGFCCDYCDFHFDQWKTETKKPVIDVWNWERELQKIFLQGDKNEEDKPSRVN